MSVVATASQWQCYKGPQRSASSQRLARVSALRLHFACPACRTDTFITASTFKCDVCKGEVRLTYSDKVALFAKHAHLE
jgi:hypothetical protein